GVRAGALGGVHARVPVSRRFPDLLLVLPFLQSDDQDLGQVGVLHGGAVRGVDGLLDLPLLQEPGDLGGVLAGLLGGLGVGVVPLDHDANRVNGHEREDDHDAPGDPAHVLGHGPEIKLHFLSPPGQGCALSAAGCYDSRKLTVTVLITGTGTPFRRVGLYTHCFTASMAAESSSGIPRRTLTSVTLPWGLMVHSRITTPCTRACLAMSGYWGFTSLIFFGSLICPQTRAACTGGGASGSPPTTPPTTPPGTPPSTPPATPPSTPRSMPSSGAICSGTSTGATNFGGSLGVGLMIGLGGGGGLGGAEGRAGRRPRGPPTSAPAVPPT